MSGYNLQLAIYDALASAPLGVQGVYDNPTQVSNPDDNGAFPFVTVGDATLSDWSDDCKSGFEASIVIHTWSRAAHHLETKQVQGNIYNALHRAELTVDGQPVITSEFVSSDAFRDSDGVTIHGVSRFRVVLSP